MMTQFTFRYYRRTDTQVQLLVEAPAMLQPGQLVALPATDGTETYARIVMIRHSSKRVLGLVTLDLLDTRWPDPQKTQARLLSAADQLAIIHQRVGAVTHPINLPASNGTLTTNAQQLGALTLIESKTPAELPTLLQHLCAGVGAYWPIIVLDPVGSSAQIPGLTPYTVGTHVQLSLEHMGWGTFSHVFGQCLPTPLQGQSLDYLLEGAPQRSGFMPFYPLIKPIMPHHPLDTASQLVIQQGLQTLRRLNLFADDEDSVWQPYRVSQPTALQCHHLPQPWRSAVLRALWQQLQVAGPHVCIMLEPERFLAEPLLSQNAEQRLIVTTPMPQQYVGGLANNQCIRRAGHWVLEGDLTGQFPLRLDTARPVEAPPKVLRMLQPTTDEAIKSSATINATPPSTQRITTEKEATPPSKVNTQVTMVGQPHTVATTEAPPQIAADVFQPEAMLTEADATDPLPTEALPFSFGLDKLDATLSADLPGNLTQIPSDDDEDYASDGTYATHDANTPLPDPLAAYGPVLEGEGYDDDVLFQPEHLTPDIPAQAEAPHQAITFVNAAEVAPPKAAETPVVLPPQPHITPPSAPVNEAPLHNQFAEGDKVRHPQFGVGVIKKIIWMDAEHEVLNIMFDRVGKRLLDPEMASLERVG
jgi:hypothetical protein